MRMRKPRREPRWSASRRETPAARATTNAVRATRSRARKWAFRVAAVLLPLLALGALELAFRALGIGHSTSFFLRREANGQAVLVDNPRFSRRFFGPGLARTAWPFQIAERKAAGTIRVFVMGGSAANGDPQPEFGLARMLEVLLRARYPAARFEVINAAMTGINSHVVLPIARDCARRDSDLWIIYMGNNEVVGPYGASTVFGRQVPGMFFIRPSLALKETRVAQAIEALLLSAGIFPDARKEWEGMQMFIGNRLGPDDPRMTAVYGHFQLNLADILRAGLHGNVRVVVATVPSNLRDCAPFASLHRAGLTETQRQAWEQFFRAGVAAQEAGKPQSAAASFQAAAAIDREYAELQFRWGQCCLAAGQDDEARQHFEKARNWDALKFRTDSRLNDLIRETARGREAHGIFLADAEQEMGRQSPHGVPGDETFWEHVHLTFEGNYRLARVIAEQADRALPEAAKGGTNTARPWISAAECAQRLAHGNWARYQATASMLMRISAPPFTLQFNHTAQFSRLQQQLEQLRPAIQPEALLQAAEQCRQAMGQAPEDWILHRQLGRLLEAVGDGAGAVEAGKRVVQLLPNSAEAHCALGNWLCHLGRPVEAQQEFQSALRLDSESAQALDGLALALALQDRNQDAVAMLRRLLRLHPASPEAHLNLAMRLRAMQRMAEAEPHFRFAIEHRPRDPGFLNRLAIACGSLGWSNEAASAWAEALELHPTDASVHLRLGTLLKTMGQSDAALEHIAAAGRLDPENAEARVRLGIELGRRGKDAEALTQFVEALRLKPDFIQARLNLGITLVRQQRFAEALTEFQEALKTDPGNVIARQYIESIQAR